MSYLPKFGFIVAENLTPVDRACMVLSTVSMLSILGHQSLRQWKEDPDSNAVAGFLTQFDVYYPSHRLCFDCLIYHRRNRLERKYQFACPQRPMTKERSTEYEFPRLGGFAMLRFRPVQLVMRADRYNITYGITLQDFEKMCRTAHVDYIDQLTRMEQPLWQRSFKAVISGTGETRHLLLRTRGVLDPLDLSRRRSSTNSIDEYCTYVDAVREQNNGFLGCKHLKEHIGSLIEDSLQRWETLSMMTRCMYCTTDYLFDFTPKCYELTTWTDFGDGISPAGNEWLDLSSRFFPGQDYRLQLISYELSDVRQRFEDALLPIEGDQFEGPSTRPSLISVMKAAASFTISVIRHLFTL